MEKQIQQQQDGNPFYSEDVFRSIALICASEIDGLSCVSENIVDSVTKILRPKSVPRGVHAVISQEENSVSLDLSVTVRQGKPLATLVQALQAATKDMVEKMTGFRVTSVNVNVLDVDWEVVQPPVEEPAGEDEENI